MKVFSIFIFSLFFFTIAMNSCFSQEKLSDQLNLMPWPKEIKSNKAKTILDRDFTISMNRKGSRVYKAATKFLRNLANKTGVFIDEGFPFYNREKATLSLVFKEEANLFFNTDESYKLVVNNNKIEITALTDVGIVRGLSTLLQLIKSDESNFVFEGFYIKDAPRFKWRGLMIDVSRHFQPVDLIKRNLDAMAFVKMNVFHWHLSDDQGFRIESKIYPKLHELGSDGEYYTQEQIKDVVAYANNLGIRVIPEIDVPGHAAAILTAYPELGSDENFDNKIVRYSGVFDPTLNPTKPEVYTFLDNLFKEVAPLFPDEYFHIGGDENEGKHWDANPKIQEFKKKNGLKSNHDLQTYFNIKLGKILRKYGKKLVGWDEIRTPSMPKSAIIHSWRGKNEGFENGTLIPALKNGYHAILSNDYYIDRMLSVDHYYKCDPIANADLTTAEESRVLGGEVTMWSELVTPLTIDSRIWPRTAAIAERFWSPKHITNIENMRKRLKYVNHELERIGLTHIRNIDVILRNVSNNQDISSLKILAGISEPLKIYNRNEGGTEYKTFSPFTLFADACSADAPDAYEFKKAVSMYKLDGNLKNKDNILSFLNSWETGYSEFRKLEKSTNLVGLELHYQKLAEVSHQIKIAIKREKFSKKDKDSIIDLLEELSTPFVDVEIVIIDTLKELSTCLNQRFDLK
ncbi:beta-N-acetylhexosaminidase [Tenacibaculum sp. 190524A05c]|uniref:beta-N-acetylhexosaminidase n=1 Tax=Tenacibaculum platacis TaxID=3137852 RepID=UPI0031FA8A46